MPRLKDGLVDNGHAIKNEVTVQWGYIVYVIGKNLGTRLNM